MRLVAISFVSWLAGLAAYVASLWLFWRQSISAGDLRAVLFWSGLATAFAVAVAYGPAMFGLRRRSSTTGWRIYVLVGVALGVIPVLLITMMFGGTFRSLLRPEAMLFGCMFTAFGAAFGTGFWIAYGRHSA